MVVVGFPKNVQALISQSLLKRYASKITSKASLCVSLRKYNSTQEVHAKDCNGRGVQLVYYDLETTGLKKPVEIVQIAAHVDVTNKWSAYVKPNRPIELGATKVTGLSTENGRLLRNGQPLVTVSLRKVLDGFIQFLANQNKPVVLIGHNIGCYDNSILLNSLNKLDMVRQLQGVDIAGYIDTLSVFRDERPGLGGYSQQKLVERYLGEGYDAHEATADVKVLKRLINLEFAAKDFLSNYIRPLAFI